MNMTGLRASGVTCARNLPQHFNGCGCVSPPGAVTAEVDIDLVDLHHGTNPDVTAAATPGAHLPDVGPTDDTYWGEGGCGAMALAFVSMVPGLKVAVEWGTGHDEGLVWHTTAYDPVTGRSFDFNGTDRVDMVLGNFDGTVEMDVDPARVAKSMRLKWGPDEPWESETVHDAAAVIDKHWGLSDEDDDWDDNWDEAS